MPSSRVNWTDWNWRRDLNFLEKSSSSASSSPSACSSIASSKVNNFLWRGMRMRSTLILLITAVLTSSSWPCVQSKYHSYHEDSNSEEIFPSGRRIHLTGNWTDVGISPPVLNLATKAYIEVNATCGEKGPETYCKLVEHGSYRRSHNGPHSRSSQCQVCDAHNSDKGKRHPIRYTIDGSNRWWQSPTLQNGRNFEWVTITIDLKQIYQVAYIIIKAAISPRPGNWILERSLDGYVYLPWQYYAISDDECWSRYRLRAKAGKPSFEDDEEVICTSYYSQLTPFEGGEIHTSLVNGRPGADGPSEALTRFTMARYVRLRFQKIRTMHGDLMSLGGGGQFLDKSVLRRYFYSIKDISIGGHCVCFGHASECVIDKESGSEKCMCQHNTCGDRCDMCCPLHNQYPWGAGNSTASARCEKCQCHGHAESCVYDKLVHEQGLSVNMNGEMDGGGVCLNCKAHTEGNNCERCVEGYHRPRGVLPEDPEPCVKCDCDAEGSQGRCVGDEEEGRRFGGKEPGDCYCKLGYEGRRCDRCAMGFRGFPRCSPCPCHIPGIVNTDCEGDCRCKQNVEGKHCSQCRPGYFNLIKEDGEGCTQCFCHGVSNSCKSSDFPIAKLRGHNSLNWLVTDLHGTKTSPAVQLGPSEASQRGNESLTYQIANEEFASFAEYYWTPEEEDNMKVFGGNRIHSYGLNVTFHVSWVQARGDTSGRPIPHYDLILKSTNALLGFNFGLHDGENATISAVLNEGNCMVLPDIDNHVIQRYPPIPPQGGTTPCTRYDVMETLSNIKAILFRAKFHTDQIEGLLHYAYMSGAITDGTVAGEGEALATSVEVCQCPEGYTGTSCEQCAYGWRKLNKDSWLTECVKCDCNGHSSSCDFEGHCLACDHNTTGAHCQHCQEGYYGDPVKDYGSSSACRRCECPLGILSNNFSPECQMKGVSYECTKCPRGYEGEYCERCGNGYYGNPAHPGDHCKPCQCSSSALEGEVTPGGGAKDICDHLTGECLVCPRNTVGWNCDECLVGHYGNPLNGSCVPCDCSDVGCLITGGGGGGSISCHVDSGQCPCKENYGGRRCDRCLDGFGNVLEGCLPCGCNQIGSVGQFCDVVTGQCPCKSGVAGRYCNKCEDNHFGFGSGKGCTPCDCNLLGCGDSDMCDLSTGQCHCLPHVIGRRCEICEPGWWNLRSGRGCDRCSCDPLGALGSTCDGETGQCICKPGVGGLRCNQCLEGHYAMTHVGCKICDPCDKPGHICNPVTGRCVCPPNTEGEECQKCQVGFWGHSPILGCQPCNCSQHGASTPQCSPADGKCLCQFGFEGDKCDQCRFGHFNYPACTSCDCDPAGTAESRCSGVNGTCSCEAVGGQCLCKDNVMGAKCDRCKPGYYGLEENNTEGCMECFCFQKTNKCSQGYFKWQRLGLLSSQNLRVVRSPGSTQYLYIHFVGQDRCYVNFAMPVTPSRVGSLLQNTDQLERFNSLMVIPDTAPDIIIDKAISFSVPLYWQLPHIFLGDKVLSYNGLLRFHTHSIAGTPVFPHHVLSTYPVIQIQGNHKLILEHFPQQTYKTGYYEVQLHEDEWRLKNGPYNGEVNKEVMMVALQNLQHILVRATYSPEVYNASLFNVSLDIAIPSPSGDRSMAHGIEVCDCPPEYNSTSCQNPRIGYYRWYKRDYITSTVIIDLVGEARRCECNGRAVSCDTESGNCQNCLENTAGPRCDLCKEGYYGNPLFGRCLPCPCPSVWNNHARSCYKLNARPYLLHPHQIQSPNQYHCQCQLGYTGQTCDRCDLGFYGRAWERGGHCTPCKCNAYGSVGLDCHEISGQCQCRPGVTGRDCSLCKDRHVIIGKECTSCNDQCTGTLLNEVEEIGRRLQGLKVDPEQVLVWKKMANLDQASRKAMAHVGWAQGVSLFLEDMPRYGGLAEMLTYRRGELMKVCGKVLTDSYYIVEKGKLLLEGIRAQDKENKGTVRFLLDYWRGGLAHPVDVSWATEEAGDIISGLEQSGMELTELTMLAEKELGEVNALYDVMIAKLFNSSGVAGQMLGGMKEAKGKLEELVELLSQAERKTEDSVRVMTTAKEFLEGLRLNLDLIDNVTMSIDLELIMGETTLGEGGYLRTELEQVLLQIEDILRDFRNTTKELEIRDNLLFDKVPLYRVLYAQPAFDHELELIMRGKYIEGLFRSVRINDSEALQASTAYDRIKEGFRVAFEMASNASLKAEESERTLQEILRENSGAQLLEVSSDLVDAGLALSGIIENGLRGNLSQCKRGIEGLSWNLKVANDSLRNMNGKLEAILQNDMRLGELSERIDEISDTISETSMTVMETEVKVHNELKARIDAIRGGAPFDAVDAAIEVSRAEHQIPTLQGEIRKHERHQARLSEKRESLEDKMKYLRALIKQSHHKANTLGVSLGPDETGTCFRIYKWPSIDSATSILFKFAPTRTEDSLLFYWPSSVNEDFIAVEMISLHIKASWDLGSGLRTLIHQTKLKDLSKDSDDPDFWYEISFERIGSSAELDVKPVSTDPSVPTAAFQTTPVRYMNTDEEATLLNLSPGDYLHIGGMSREMRTGLVDNGLMSGCLHDLRVNHQPLGLWNFARTEGCRPCVECPDISLETMPSGGNMEYYFDGRGYSVISRIQSQTFNSRFFDVGIEFKTFSENGLIFLTVNDTIGQIIALEMKEGRIIMQVRHRWEDQRDALRVESEDKYNTGNWTVLRAIWVFQRGQQTAKLIIDRKDFTQEKRSTGSLSLKLHESSYQLGGISPTFDPSKWDDVLTILPYVGCMKNILVDGSSYDAMSGHYFGVQSPCSGKSVFKTSFEGNGFAEFGSQPVGKNFKLGFSFKTMEPTGLMLLSTFARSLDSPDEHYYAVYLAGGKVHIQIGVPQGPFDLLSNGSRYDDGRWHSVRFFKKSRKLYLYMDDEELAELRLPKQATATVNAPFGRGLFIGGTTQKIQRKFEETPLQVRQGFKGCIQNFYFGNELLNFNYPVAYQNQNLGQCPPHHDPDPLLLLHASKYHPNTIDISGGGGGGRHEAIVRMTDPECTPHSDPVIQQEEPFKAWQFGDAPNSYATLSLLGSKILKQSFNITFHFRTLYPNGMLFQGLKKRSRDGSYCLMSFLKDGQVIVKLHGNRPQDLVSSVSGLNDGKWHQITIVKAEDKLFLHIDGRNGTQTQVPKIKAIARMHIGGVPGDGQDCLENSIHKPEHFKGCLKNFIINSHFYNLDSNSAHLNNVGPCFRHVEPGSFFRTGSYAIFSHNFTLGAMLEVQLDFRSDSRSGLLLKLLPNKPSSSSRYPQFSILLKDGKVIARETLSQDEYYEAVADFQQEMKGYVCDGQWHTIRCNYEKGSITLRVDNRPPIFALAEPDSLRIGGGATAGTSASGGIFPGSSDVATIFIGGTDDGASRSNNKAQFHGCIRNIVLNHQIRDWTDMALVHNVFLNSCPL